MFGYLLDRENTVCILPKYSVLLEEGVGIIYETDAMHPRAGNPRTCLCSTVY